MPSLRTIAEIGVVVVAFLALAIDFRDDQVAKQQAAPPPHVTDSLRAALLRCQLLGKAALDDTTCTAVWAENRKRFFGSQLGTNAQHSTVAK
jgi:conjugative transfer region protein TrbK